MKEIRNFEHHETGNVACLLADSFESNPVYMHIFDDPLHRKEALAWFFKNLRIGIVHELGGFSLGLFEDGECISTMTLGSIQSQKPSNINMIRNGVLLWPFYAGLPSLLRALKLGDTMTSLSHQAHGTTDLELMMVATDKNHRGRGYGSRLLQAAIEKARSLNARSIGLSTQTESNVRFYTKAGFVVTSEHDLLAGTKDQFRTWSMQLIL
jgi:ribosomal protein S18 acetylase RimI-like enzyme